MSYIFISYSRKDIKVAKQIVAALTQKRLETWIDWESIPQGEDWEKEIYRGIADADAFVFLMSPHSARSKMCNKEIARAVKYGKRILPIVIRDTKPEHFLRKSSEKEISIRNWIYCRKEKGDSFRKAIAQTQETVQKNFEWLKFHTQLQSKSLAWESTKDHSRLLRGKELQEAEQWLATIGPREDPQPTKLQREYVFLSRKVEESQRRRITIGLAVGLGVLLILSIFALMQRNEAIMQRSVADSEAARAEREAHIAVARMLADKSLQEPGGETAALLAVESLKRAITSEGTNAIVRSLSLLPKLYYEDDLQGLELSNISIKEGSSPSTLEKISYHIDELRLTSDNEVFKVWLMRSTESPKVKIAGWDLGSRKRILAVERKFEEGTFLQQEKNLAISGDSTWFAYFSNRKLSLLNIRTGQERTLRHYSEDLESIRFDSGNEYLYARSQSGNLSAWSMDDFSQTMDRQLDGIVEQLFYLPSMNALLENVSDGLFTSRIVLSELKSGEETVLASHGQILGLSRDERYIVLGIDAGLRVFDTKEMKTTIERDLETYISIEPDAAVLFTRRPDGPEVHLWDLESGQLQQAFLSPCTESLSAIALSSDGAKLAISCTDGEVAIWDAETGVLALKLSLGYSVDRILFSPDGKLILAANVYPFPAAGGFHTSQASVFDVSTGAEIGLLNHGSYYFAEGIGRDLPVSIMFSSDGNYIISIDDEKLRIWSQKDAWNQQIASLFHAGAGIPNSVQWGHAYAMPVFSPGGNLLAVGGGNPEVELWKLDPLETVKKYEQVTGPGIPETADTIEISPDDKWVAFTGLFCQSGINCDNDVRIMPTSPGKELFRIDYRESTDSNPIPYSRLAFSPDSNWLVAAWSDNVLHAWSTESWQLMYDFSISSMELWHMSQNVNQTAFIDPENVLRVLNLSTGQATELLPVDPGLSVIALTSDKKYLATGDTAGSVNLWNTTTHRKLFSIAMSNSVERIYFDSTENFIAVEDRQTLEIWRLSDGALKASIKKPARFGDYSYSLDKSWAITGTSGSIIVLDTKSGEEIAHFPTHMRDLSANHQYYTAETSVRGTAGVWQWNPSSLIEEACTRLTRNLTMSEWSKYFETEPYQQTCKNRPVDQSVPKYYVQQGDVFARNESIERAVGEYDRANAYSPGFIPAPLDHARCVYAEYQINQGDGAAYRGEDAAALLHYQKALETCSGIIENAQKRLDQKRSERLLSDGDQFAMSGDLDAAVDLYQKAKELQPGTVESPQDRVWWFQARKNSQELVDRADNLAREGNYETALKQYEAANAMSAGAIENPRHRVDEIKATNLLNEAIARLSQGEVDTSIQILFDAMRTDPSLDLSADQLNYFCWWGTLANHAQAVMEMCQAAVALEPTNGAIRDSRGLNRALLQDYANAIKDFEFFVQWASSNNIDDTAIDRRKSWIKMLKENQNPFTTEELTSLKSE